VLRPRASRHRHHGLVRPGWNLEQWPERSDVRRVPIAGQRDVCSRARHHRHSNGMYRRTRRDVLCPVDSSFANVNAVSPATNPPRRCRIELEPMINRRCPSLTTQASLRDEAGFVDFLMPAWAVNWQRGGGRRTDLRAAEWPRCLRVGERISLAPPTLRFCEILTWTRKSSSSPGDVETTAGPAACRRSCGSCSDCDAAARDRSNALAAWASYHATKPGTGNRVEKNTLRPILRPRRPAETPTATRSTKRDPIARAGRRRDSNRRFASHRLKPASAATN